MSDRPIPVDPDGARRTADGTDAGNNQPLIIAVAVLTVLLIVGVLYVILAGDDADRVVIEDSTPPPAEVTPTPTAEEDEGLVATEPPPVEDEAAAPDPVEDGTTAPTPGTPTPVPGTGVEDEGPPPILFTGTGTVTTDPFDHDGGLVVLTYQQAAGESFTVTAVPDGGDGAETEVVPATTAERGQRGAALPAGRYRLEVTASAEWTTDLARPVITDATGTPRTFEGRDEQVTDPFSTTGVDVRIALEHADGGDIDVRVLDADGEEIAVLSFAGSGEETISLDEGIYLLEVQTAGAWRAIIS